MTDEKNNNDAAIALCRSGIYEALTLGFRPPVKETFRRLISKERNSMLAKLVSIIDEDLVDDVSKLAVEMNAKMEDKLKRKYDNLFGHSARSSVPPYETEFGDKNLFQQPHQLADISGFLIAFGLELNVAKHERIDHVACELEFMCFLTRKEAYAIQNKKSAMLKETLKAERSFLKDHLARFTPTFSHLCIKEDQGGFYGNLGKLLRNFVQIECARFDLKSGS
ncbi:MAG: molecular chaperone TorD family protein, partial [Candidatus Marinimicrobia bacterium]|nr:molecular chaperone TorD family protein [Candidatus Neomarinimicrobiota bacterium]